MHEQKISRTTYAGYRLMKLSPNNVDANHRKTIDYKSLYIEKQLMVLTFEKIIVCDCTYTINTVIGNIKSVTQ